MQFREIAFCSIGHHQDLRCWRRSSPWSWWGRRTWK